MHQRKPLSDYIFEYITVTDDFLTAAYHCGLP